MTVVARKRGSGITYYVKFAWQGKDVWENTGRDRREAERVNARRLREVRAGTYLPPGQRVATTVGQYLRTWLDGRENRTADDDRARVEHHVMGREWFVSMPIADARPRQMIQLIAELKTSPRVDGNGTIAGKTVALIYGALRTMFRDARIAELTSEDPCVLPRGLLRVKSKVRRLPYEPAEMRKILTTPGVAPRSPRLRRAPLLHGHA
jgi:hypothetical protein